MTKLSYKQWLQVAKQKCRITGVEESAPVILLEFVCKKPRVYFRANDNLLINDSDLVKLDAFLERYLNFEPLAYIIGSKEFYARDFIVTPSVLIPRPETELIIDEAIAFFKNNAQSEPIKFCDIGSGSGCIGVSLLCEIENSACTSFDVSENALEVSHRNATLHNVSEKIKFIYNDIRNEVLKNSTMERQAPLYDCIVSNPPYIPEVEYNALEKNVKDYEPQVALTSGVSGYEIIEAVLEYAKLTLKPGGLLLIEHGYNQDSKVQEIARSQGIWKTQENIQDYAGHGRIFKAIKL